MGKAFTNEDVREAVRANPNSPDNSNNPYTFNDPIYPDYPIALIILTTDNPEFSLNR
jgi:hypothetical protein